MAVSVMDPARDFPVVAGQFRPYIYYRVQARGKIENLGMQAVRTKNGALADLAHLVRFAKERRWRVVRSGVVGEELRGNPSTRRARRFVAAKIRTLRREGKPERAAVGEALAMGRRRGFRSIPKRPRRANPLAERNTIVSEREAWKAVESAALRILERKVGAATAGAIHGYAENIRNWAVVMLDQLKAGVHENPRRRANPIMGLIANESPAVFTVSKRVKEIVYIHAQDGEEYVHPFAPGVSATFLQDGRCVLWRRDGKPVGGRRIGNTIRPIGG